MSEDLVIISTDATHVVAAWRGHMLAVWHDTMALEPAEICATAALRLARARPGRSAYICIVHEDQRMLPPEIRDVHIRLGRELQGDLLCCVAVVEGQGFQASALRSLITGFGIAARVKFPLRCFATLDEAASYVDERLRAVGERMSMIDLAQAFAELERERLAAMSQPEAR